MPVDVYKHKQSLTVNSLQSTVNRSHYVHHAKSSSLILQYLFIGELKMSAKRTTMGRFTPKYPELDQQILECLPNKENKVTV